MATPAGGRINEHAAAGMLVVQICHFGTVFREILRLASRKALITPSVRTPGNEATTPYRMTVAGRCFKREIFRAR
jgi:hypothetical protein